MKNAGYITLLTLTAAVTIGCARDQSSTGVADPAAAPAVAASPSLAWVNGSAVTEDDVGHSIVTAFGANAYAGLSADTRKTVLESLVISRAIALKAESELDAEGRHSLAQEMRAHKEQLLVKRYLRDHAAPQPISETMIRDYYAANAEKFGGGIQSTIEIISAAADVAESQRAAVLEAVGGAVRQPDWDKYADGLRTRGLKVNYARSVMEPELLDKRLVRAAAGLKQGEVSKTILINGAPYLLRVAEQNKREPRPLDDVRGDIRKALLPRQLKKAIQQVSASIMAEADVKYAGGVSDDND